MPLNLGDTVPNFEADTTAGKIQFHDFIGDSWAILFSHPSDYTPVCTTELGQVQKLIPEFQARGVKVIALSCDSVADHLGWIEDVKGYNGLSSFDYPIIADPTRELANLFGMIDAKLGMSGMPVTCRAVFIFGPDKKMKLQILYPASTGRNFAEILRVVDSLQLTANYSVATPANWTQGERCMVVPSLSDEAAAEKFPKGFDKASLPSGKGYIRLTPQPNL